MSVVVSHRHDGRGWSACDEDIFVDLTEGEVLDVLDAVLEHLRDVSQVAEQPQLFS